MPMVRLHSGLPSSYPVRPLVSFALFAGGGGTIVAAAVGAVSLKP